MAAKKQATVQNTNAHTKIYGVGFLVAVAVFAVAGYFAQKRVPMGWEVTWFHEVNGWSDGWYRFMVIVTFFGSTLWAPIAVGIALVLRLYRLAWRLAATVLGAYTVVYIAKHFIDRERPLGLIADVHARVTETGMGFPSGHATLITVVMLTLLPYVSKRWRWLLPVPIFLVCLSRVYLGVHVPLDVIGGVAIGTAGVAFLRILPKQWRILLRVN